LKTEVAILEVLFPDVRAGILRVLWAAPHKERYVRDLMTVTGLALSTVQDELRKLRTIGLVTYRSNGFRHFYRANRGHVLFEPIRSIVQSSAKLPTAKESGLRRPARKGRKRRRSKSLPPDQLVNWGLFSPNHSGSRR
jgi:hypothetical protein